MTDPSRWNEEGADDFERSLLGSAKSDRMPEASRHRIAAALATVTVAGTLEATTSTSTTTGGLLGTAKLVLISAMIAIGAAAAVYLLRSGTEERAATTVSAPPENAPRREQVSSSNAVAVEPTVRVEDLPAAASPASKPASPRTSPPVVASAPGRAAAGSNLAAEAALLDGARALLRSGDLAGASASLDAYEREFAAGALAYEAGVMRVDLLVARGERAEAKVRARKLLERQPNGPYATRLRALVDGGH